MAFLLAFLAIGYGVSGIWLHRSFHIIPYAIRHMRVGALAGHRVYDH